MYSKTNLFAILALFYLLRSSVSCPAQAINPAGKLVCILPSKVQVTLFPTLQQAKEYYYLPTGLRISPKEDVSPEFMFMAWKNEGSTKIDGGILHWLLTWGLSKNEEKYVRSFLISQVDSSAVLMGVVTADVPLKYQFQGKNSELIALLQRSISSGGNIPTESGGKSATSFRFSADDASIIEQYILHPEKVEGVFVEMPFLFPNGQEMCQLHLPLKLIFQAGAKCPSCLILPK